MKQTIGKRWNGWAAAHSLFLSLGDSHKPNPLPPVKLHFLQSESSLSCVTLIPKFKKTNKKQTKKTIVLSKSGIVFYEWNLTFALPKSIPLSSKWLAFLSKPQCMPGQVTTGRAVCWFFQCTFEDINCFSN